ncbi:hypothetical protein INT47_001913 [Mucor saturninus]|uniref:PHD-type domain-containing protein n=1 Tax=Mucor saturninus TaxID=64648 RepID=A0A8H7V771_9FUNG|nr:hypothetical protein INT47_001913 [Mucor saturninus]
MKSTCQTKEIVYLNRVQQSSVTKKSTLTDIKAIAKTLKSRLSHLSKRFVQPSVNNTSHHHHNKYVSMETLSKLSSADWSIPPSPLSTASTTPSTPSTPKRRRPVLHHLDLLKRYLTFVASETQIDLHHPNQIEFTFTNNHELLQPQSTLDHASRLGATLIEMAVHDPLEKIQPPKVLNGASRRRPGRPPKEITTAPMMMKKKDTIQCICTSSRQEFGVMVQCDDCCHWLHLECLALDEKALAETFRCPRCFIQMDDDHSLKLLSTVTWRYAARHQSKVLASLNHHTHPEEEEEEEDEYDEMSSLGMDDVSSIISSADTYDESQLIFDEGDSDWPSSSSSSSSSNSSSSCSEAGTPSEYHFGGDDHWFVPPSSANVFLWNNNTTLFNHPPYCTSSLSLSLTPDVEPSAVCAQELPEFNFWETSF